MPKTATNETSVSPIISAAAVEAVRPGLRTAFSCARPSGGAAEAGGRQADDVRERANEPRRDRSEADEEAEGAAGDPEDPHARRDARRRECRRRARTPTSPVTTSPKTSVFRDGRLTTIPPSRTAEIGAIRVARTAGQTEATSVTSVPVSIATTAVRVWKTIAGLRQLEVDGPEERRQSLREQDAEPGRSPRRRRRG